jgi:hypothetical protein
MPFKSEAQRAYFNAHRAEFERQGVNVEEWNEASRGMNLPEKATKKLVSTRGKMKPRATALQSLMGKA